LKCVRCGKGAEYIFIAYGIGGSLCKECFEQDIKELRKKSEAPCVVRKKAYEKALGGV
jgi:hypothetical protein